MSTLEELLGWPPYKGDSFRVKHLIGWDVKDLSFVQLQYIREVYRAGEQNQDDPRTTRIWDGGLQIYINDDYHPPGWYEYRPWEGETPESLLQFAVDKQRERMAAFNMKFKHE